MTNITPNAMPNPAATSALSRRALLKTGLQSGLALGAFAALPASHAELIELMDAQAVNPPTSTPAPLSEPLPTETIAPAPFDFATIKAECEAIRGIGVPMHLLAPSGFGSDEQRNLLAIHRLTQAGFYIDNPEVISRRYLRFAGRDSERLGDLTVFLDKPVAQLPKILLGVRGGYGAMRLLNGLSDNQWHTLTQKFKQRGTLLMGFSDVTALQLAMLAKGNMPYVAGCMLGSDFGKPVVNPIAIQSFIHLCTQHQLIINVPQPQSMITKPRITGKMWGGNLSVLAAMVGTPYLPKIDGGILFLEDTGEQPYRIERMLQTLALSGILARQQAIVLGKFNFNGISDAYNGDYTFDTVIAYLHEKTRLPIYTEFPFGHVAERVNFPLGVPVTLEAVGSGYRATFNQFYNLKNERNFNTLKLQNLRI